jgi:signal transduction histidine kinase
VKSINPIKSVIQTIYDIVTKGHNGELKVNSVLNEGSIFTIVLPI